MSEHDPMRPDPEDERLRRLFVEMRREDMERVPAFPAIEKAPQTHGILRLVPAAAAAALALLVAVWLWLPAGDVPVGETLLVEWSAPSTGFLGLDGKGDRRFGRLDAGAQHGAPNHQMVQLRIHQYPRFKMAGGGLLKAYQKQNQPLAGG